MKETCDFCEPTINDLKERIAQLEKSLDIQRQLSEAYRKDHIDEQVKLRNALFDEQTKVEKCFKALNEGRRLGLKCLGVTFPAKEVGKYAALCEQTLRDCGGVFPWEEDIDGDL